jgi:hypothetical protein
MGRSPVRVRWAVAVVCVGIFASRASAQTQAQTPAVRIEAPSCVASWFDGEVFARALSVELVADGLRVDPAGAMALALEVPCDEEAEAVITLAIGETRRAVSLVDLPPSVRMRALALASRDFIDEVLAQPARVVDVEPIEEVPVEELPVEEVAAPHHDAIQLADPIPTAVVEPIEPPAPLAPWLAIAITARGTWLGLRVVAPSLSVEGEARVAGTPLSFWLALDGLYAWGSDGLGEVRAFDVGGRLGARVAIDLAPVSLSASLGLLVAYGRGDGVTSVGGARSSGIDGALVGIDLGASGALAVSSDVRLVLSLGALAYVVGFEARAEDRPVISFRDVAPWASFGVSIDLRP